MTPNLTMPSAWAFAEYFLAPFTNVLVLISGTCMLIRTSARLCSTSKKTSCSFFLLVAPVASSSPGKVEMETSVTSPDLQVAKDTVDCFREEMPDATVDVSCVVDVPPGCSPTTMMQVLNHHPELMAQLEQADQVRVSSASMDPIQIQAMVQAVLMTLSWRDCLLPQVPLRQAQALHTGIHERIQAASSGIRNLQPLHEHEQGGQADIHFQTTLNEQDLREVIASILGSE